MCCVLCMGEKCCWRFMSGRNVLMYGRHVLGCFMYCRNMLQAFYVWEKRAEVFYVWEKCVAGIICVGET